MHRTAKQNSKTPKNTLNGDVRKRELARAEWLGVDCDGTVFQDTVFTVELAARGTPKPSHTTVHRALAHKLVESAMCGATSVTNQTVDQYVQLRLLLLTVVEGTVSDLASHRYRVWL